ncbi:MAG: protein-L-isoaspartate(D-aspartate) O-methyltransferase [Deltaproteobacteria bacterium]|nr:protein-L-isoaspartate(D-aspartate) O-methyltransferase [Deltaproteobacteria bacterium]
MLVAGGAASDADPFAAMRLAMVEEQIAARGVKDEAVLAAMRKVPRHEFVPEDGRREAYADHPLPIGHGQTISQPYIVAFMTAALGVRRGHKVLEVGTGSGYQAAVLAEMGADVYTIEIVEPLGRTAAALLKRLGYKVHARVGDGYDGWPTAAPFDGIMVTAAPERVPAPLETQLKEGGRLVIPVGRNFQELKVFRKSSHGLELVNTLPVRFVPMTGKVQGG